MGLLESEMTFKLNLSSRKFYIFKENLQIELFY